MQTREKHFSLVFFCLFVCMFSSIVHHKLLVIAGSQQLNIKHEPDVTMS